MSVIDREKSAKGIKMAKQDSFKKAAENAKTAGFKKAVAKIDSRRTVNLMEQFNARNMFEKAA